MKDTCWTFARLHNMFLIIQKIKNSTQFQTINKTCLLRGVANVIARCFRRSYVHKNLSMQWLASYLLIHKMHDRPQWCALLYFFMVSLLYGTHSQEKKKKTLVPTIVANKIVKNCLHTLWGIMSKKLYINYLRPITT